jgi:hypothetical protein
MFIMLQFNIIFILFYYFGGLPDFLLRFFIQRFSWNFATYLQFFKKNTIIPHQTTQTFKKKNYVQKP